MNPETVLHAEGREFKFEQGRDCGLQKKRRRQSPIQVKRDSVAATLSDRTIIQVA